MVDESEEVELKPYLRGTCHISHTFDSHIEVNMVDESEEVELKTYLRGTCDISHTLDSHIEVNCKALGHALY
jgi:hypothetical protein